MFEGVPLEMTATALGNDKLRVALPEVPVIERTHLFGGRTYMYISMNVMQSAASWHSGVKFNKVTLQGNLNGIAKIIIQLFQAILMGIY